MIGLYAHNRAAYEAAAAMLDETGKAAVIHPTGTGKSFIAFKLCEDHPDKTVCWLSPSEYIFQTQRENLAATGVPVPQNICFYTYAKLMKMSEAELSRLHADYVILDSAPAGLLTDAVVLAQYADAAVLVVRKDFARVDTIMDGLEHLAESHIQVVGSVLNGV